MTHGLGDAVGGVIYIIDEIIKCIHEQRINDALLTATKARREAEGYQAVAKVYQGRMNDQSELIAKLKVELSATQKELDEYKLRIEKEKKDESPTA